MWKPSLLHCGARGVNGCNHCNWCIKNQTLDRPYVQDDEMEWIYPKLLEADGIILASPAHFGRMSGLMANMVGRTRAFVHGSVYQFPLKNKIGGAMAMAFFRGGGIETTLSSIDLFFLTQKMIVATRVCTSLGPGRIQVSKGKAGLKRSLATLFLKTNTVPNRLGCWLTGLWNLPE